MPSTSLPLVDYLDVTVPVLMANQCQTCSARYFDRRNVCAACSGSGFDRVPISPVGTVLTYTIVHKAAPGVNVPFVAAVIDCDGDYVSGNLVNVAPKPEAIPLGMNVRLVTFVIGVDENGTEAIGFGFEPITEIKVDADG